MGGKERRREKRMEKKRGGIMIKYSLLILFVVFGVLSSQAQQERKFIREGNELFEKQDFEKAEVEYRKAADKKNESFEAAFNMADALYKQKNMMRLCSNFLLWLNSKRINNGWEKFTTISVIRYCLWRKPRRASKRIRSR